jgi:hypothetical protein
VPKVVLHKLAGADIYAVTKRSTTELLELCETVGEGVLRNGRTRLRWRALRFQPAANRRTALAQDHSDLSLGRFASLCTYPTRYASVRRWASAEQRIGLPVSSYKIPNLSSNDDCHRRVLG